MSLRRHRSGGSLVSSLHAALREAGATGGRLVVCGGGATGIEAATELAGAFPGLRVTMVTRGSFAGDLSRRGQAHLAQVFDRRGIDVLDHATVERVRERGLDLAGRSPVPFGVCLWAGSFAVPSIAREAGLEVNERGQAIVDPFLRSRSHPEILVAGDAAAPAVAPGAPIRMACATAMPMGAQAAETIATSLAGEEPRPFGFGYIFLNISLGRTAGLSQPLYADDRPRERIVTGRPGAWIKEAVSRFTMIMIALERRWPGVYRWSRGQTMPTAGRAGASSARRAAL